ncbi:MAG: phosphatidate cytidylyltransferase [Sphingomonadaceae bacterium]
MSSLATRTIVGALLIVVAITALWIGGTVFWMLLTLGGLLMLREYALLLGCSGHEIRTAQFAFCIPLGVIAPLAAGPNYFAIGLIFGMAAAVYIVSRKSALGAGLVYFGLAVFALIWLREHSGGFVLTLWALALVWATDIGAFFAGRAIGGPKLAPAISPNKTWAGVGGGVLAALALGWALHLYADLPVTLAIFSAPLAMVSQLGDLLESAMKRRAGVKDSGTILPGHGGIFDRLDGLVASAPFAALIVVLGTS